MTVKLNKICSTNFSLAQAYNFFLTKPARKHKTLAERNRKQQKAMWIMRLSGCYSIIYCFENSPSFPKHPSKYFLQNIR